MYEARDVVLNNPDRQVILPINPCREGYTLSGIAQGLQPRVTDVIMSAQLFRNQLHGGPPR